MEFEQFEKVFFEIPPKDITGRDWQNREAGFQPSPVPRSGKRSPTRARFLVRFFRAEKMNKAKRVPQRDQEKSPTGFLKIAFLIPRHHKRTSSPLPSLFYHQIVIPGR
jgi:hypothetical protein